MNLAYIVRRAFETLRADGPVEVLRRVYRRIVPPRVPPHPFDLTHGIDTGGLIQTKNAAHPSAPHGTAYWGVAPSLFRGALARWRETLTSTPYTLSDYTFLDLGSGKGRALMLASELPFRRIIGVELDPTLAAIAHANVTRWCLTPHPCLEIETVHGDALTHPLPATPFLLYLYNPFDAHLLGQLLNRVHALAATRSTPIDILYARPEHADLIDSVRGIQILWKGEVPFTPEDTAADVFQTTQQQCFLYRLPPSPGTAAS